MFGGLPLGVNLLLFAAGAGVVWFAGTRLEWMVDAIARRTGLGQAFAGRCWRIYSAYRRRP